MGWSFLYITGSINLLFIALVILNINNGKKSANRILAFLFFLWSWGFFYTWIIETSAYLDVPHFILAGAPNTFLMGPCIYYYARYLITPGIQFSKKYLIHGIPFFLHLAYLVPFYAQSGISKIEYWEKGRTDDLIFYGIVVLQIVHLSGYLVVVIKILHEYRKKICNTHSSLAKVNLSWLSNISAALAAGLVFFTGAMLWFLYEGIHGVYINRVSDVFNLVLIHLAGYRGLVQSDIFREESSTVEKYRKSSLSSEDLSGIVKKLREYMLKENAFLDSELTLQKLSSDSGIPSHHITQALNQGEGLNFYEFVNRFRVEYACKLINRINEEKRTFLEIAFLAGFNSKSTFNTLFREYCGMTPSQYKKIISL